MPADKLSSRRALLSGSASLAAAALLPACAADIAQVGAGGGVSSPVALRRNAGAPGPLAGRMLVLVELQGGNDGINTLVPIGQPAYRRLRPAIAIPAEDTIPLDDAQALHPELRPLVAAYGNGEMAIVNAVGYPRPNRSHFRSIEIWEQATDSDRYADRGWVTRALAEHPLLGRGGRADADAIVVGAGTIGPLAGPGTRVVTLRDARQFLAQSEALRGVDLRSDATDSLRHVVRTQNEAVAAAGAVRRKLSGRNRFDRRFGGDPFGRSLALAADLIADGVDVPVWKATIGSFDTHADQPARHARLLGRLAAGLAALREAMIDLGRWNDTLVVTYSEFGRRAAENGSRGTDHGTAAPLFALGGAVDGGIRGAPPDLEALVDGDIRAQTDFRSVYAGILAGWWETPDNFLARQGHQPIAATRQRIA